jgi:hypothetical protein
MRDSVRGHRICRVLICFVAFVSLAGTPSARAQLLAPEVIVKSGQQVPGEPGVTFGVPSPSPTAPTFASASISNSGTALIYGSTIGAGITEGTNAIGLWTWQGGVIQKVLRQGEVAPGAGGALYGQSAGSAPMMSGSGIAVYHGVLTGTGVTTSNDSGLWVGTADTGMTLAVRKGDTSPNVAGATFSTLTPHAINASGSLIFSSTLVGGGVTTANDFGYWTRSSTGTITPFLREGDVAPGTGGVTFAASGVGLSTSNTSGVGVFRNALTLGGAVTSSNNAGIWAGTAGNVQLYLRSGNIAPVTGGTLSGFSNPSVLQDGRVVISGTLVNGGAVTSANNQAVWAGDSPANLQLLFRKGDAVTGLPSGVVLNSIGIFRTSGNNFSFFTTVTGTGVTTANDRAIFSWTPAAGLTTVAREGDVAPNTGGALFGQIGTISPLGGAILPSISKNGSVAFYVPLTGAGVTTANDTAIFFRDGSGLFLIARKGDVYDLDPGAGVDNATIANLNLNDFSLASEDVGYSPFNEAGGFYWTATFTDGRTALFYSPVPEPASVLAILTVGLFGAGQIRRRLLSLS